jgi:hypothetical protein
MTLRKHEVRPSDTEVEQWLDQLDPVTTRVYDATPHRQIIAASKALADAEDGLRKAVADARAAGYSWAMVGASLGISRQAAQQRFGQEHRGTWDVVPTPYRPDPALNVGAQRQRGANQNVASKPNDRHVVKNPEGGWDVIGADAKRRSAHTDTQQQAIDRAREIVHNAGGGEVVIHDRQGRIRDKDTIAPGNDPNSPRDKR